MYVTLSLVFLSLGPYVFQSCTAQLNHKGLSLSERVQQLTDMNQKRSYLKFNYEKFKEYVKSTPRNYSMIVMFTALSPKHQCGICRYASDEFVIVANSFRYSQVYSNKLFFAMVDFDDGRDVFNMLKLSTAPTFMHFPAKGKLKNADTFDIQKIGYSAEVIAKWIAERTDIQIRVFRPPNYSSSIVFIMMFAFAAGFLYIRRNNLDFLYNKNIWGIGAICFCFAMVSGQMWNHIRSPPFLHRTQDSIAYFHGSSQGQFVLETYIIILLNAAIVLGMIMMTEAAARKQGDLRMRQIITVVGLVLVAVFYSVILSIFRSKAHGYPYSFLFK